MVDLDLLHLWPICETEVSVDMFEANRTCFHWFTPVDIPVPGLFGQNRADDNVDVTPGLFADRRHETW